MQIIFKQGTYNYRDLTEEQLKIVKSDLWINMHNNDTLKITSGLLVKLDDGIYKKFSNNLSYLEYLYDKRTVK